MDVDGNPQCCANCVGQKKGKDGKPMDDCCSDGHMVDPITGICIPCPAGQAWCAGNKSCCKVGEQCCGTADKATCCPKGLSCQTETGECCDKTKFIGGKCCDYENTKTECCAEGQKVSNGVCKDPCPRGSTDETKWCTPPQECRTVTTKDGATFSGCSGDDCKATVEWHPVPANLYPPDKSDNPGIPVCEDVTKTPKTYWFCEGSGEAIANPTRSTDAILNADKCTEVDCWGLLGPETGNTFASYDATTGKCMASVDCAKNVDTSRTCSELLATAENQPGWQTSLYNPDSPTYNPGVNANRAVVCLESDGKPTGQICPEFKVCGPAGQCMDPYILAPPPTKFKDTSTLQCREATVDDYTSKHPRFASLQDCRDALKDTECAAGFARAGFSEDEMGCYRFGFPTNWNPGVGDPDECIGGLNCHNLRPDEKVCQKPEYGGMPVSAHESGTFHTTWHPRCDDRNRTVPPGAWRCEGEYKGNGDRSRPSKKMTWKQCQSPAGCVSDAMYSYDDGDHCSNIGFCGSPYAPNPTYGQSVTDIEPPNVPLGCPTHGS